MKKITAYVICFTITVVWAIAERIFLIDSIFDQVIIAIILLIFIMQFL